ncbi:MAG: iron chelate uptake ABC transporter family permease subunit [Planctomycetes bacterium]|nr:iron chelate uptake ABC transporter family permease subunit [Planctomycetota bacterium]
MAVAPLTLKRVLLVSGGLALALVLTMAAATLVGSELAATKVLHAGLAWARGLRVPEGTTVYDIVVRYRLPRVLLAALTGCALAAAGVTFQGLLRNPLADPYILGVSSGAALGAVITMLFLAGSAPYGLLVVFSLAGALGAITVVYVVSNVRGHISRHTLLLVGVVVNACLGAVIMFLTAVASPSQLTEIIRWLMGVLDNPFAPRGILPVLAAAVAVGVLVLYVQAGRLNLLVLGEETAGHLGVEAERTKRTCFVAASLVTAATVAVTGPIGFVGLIVPHVVRLLSGSDHRLLLPAATLAGGVFLVVCDAAVRAAGDLFPVGVVTAMFGGPFFIILLKREQKRIYFD